MGLLDKYSNHIINFNPIRSIGAISRVKGILLESLGPKMFVGETARVYPAKGRSFLAEATALHGRQNYLMAYEETGPIEAGNRVVGLGMPLAIPVGPHLLGRVLNSMGKAVDNKGRIKPESIVSVFNEAPSAMERKPIAEQIQTGVRAIDSMLPVGKGQRMGIFAGSGVGKSTLLGMIARNSGADVNVIALIGERGREVREFIENDLGEEGLKRSIIIESTSDTSPLARVRGAYAAASVAEYFRDQGNDVMLLFDSVTRFAMAQREIGLAVGEPPASRGYTPSVFSQLPKILERSGTARRGSITAFYTVLVEGDDLEEPIADAVRGILDGHIVLSRQLAESAHFPSIDVLKSISRLAPKIQDQDVLARAQNLRKLMAVYRDAEDLIRVGAYAVGSDSLIDEAIAKKPEIDRFLQQGINESSSITEAVSQMESLAVEGFES